MRASQLEAMRVTADIRLSRCSLEVRPLLLGELAIALISASIQRTTSTAQAKWGSFSFSRRCVISEIVSYERSRELVTPIAWFPPENCAQLVGTLEENSDTGAERISGQQACANRVVYKLLQCDLDALVEAGRPLGLEARRHVPQLVFGDRRTLGVPGPKIPRTPADGDRCHRGI